MKKLIVLFTALILLNITVAAQAETLVVWFSCTGHTAAIAAKAAEALGADLWQIVPQEPYTAADLNYSDNSCRANREQEDDSCRPAFVGSVEMENYDSVLIAYPIWWGEEPRIIDTWLESVDLSGKRTAAMCTSGSSGIQTSYEHLQGKAPDALWLGAKRFPLDTSLEDIAEWCNMIGLARKEGTCMTIRIGEHALRVRLAANESADALQAMLTEGPLTISASNYGGFEKVCPLGMTLPSEDVYTVTQPGDVMLYAGSNMVLFHGSNSWDYTRLGWIDDTTSLREILSGNEDHITLEIGME